MDQKNRLLFPVKEQNLLLKLLRKTRINETQISSIQQAIQKAFKRQKLYHKDLMVRLLILSYLSYRTYTIVIVAHTIQE